MGSPAPCFIPSPPREARLEYLLEQLSELTGQRNAIDGRIIDIVAEIDRDGLWSTTGCRSVAALVAWKTGTTPRNAKTITAVAHRADQFPQCTDALREGQLSLDQVGVIAERAADGSDTHYAQLAAAATVTQLRTAIKLEPTPPTPEYVPKRAITKTEDEHYTTWRITLPRLEAATFDAALDSHREALIAAWRRDRDQRDAHGGADPTGTDPNLRLARDVATPMPTTVDAFISLIEAGWDTDVAARPHGGRSTVIAHLDVDQRTAALHLGPILSDADRRLLLCDTTCEVWLHRHGTVIGAGRTTRVIGRRLRRALERRDHGTCVVPGCGATGYFPSLRSPRKACRPTTCGIGRTVAPPNCGTWRWSAPITTACTTAANSPSPDPRTGSSSPTATAPS